MDLKQAAISVSMIVFVVSSMLGMGLGLRAVASKVFMVRCETYILARSKPCRVPYSAS